MRYRFYRVHKYVCFELSEFDRLVAKTDFLDPEACKVLSEKLTSLTQLLKHHGEYEDAHIHALLRQKESQLQLAIELDHQDHEQAFNTLCDQLTRAIEAHNPEEKIQLGNAFYLSYRLFYCEMLKHLYEEETVLLPELQALYTDAELAKLQAKTYEKMTSEQMLGMLNVLFPHANPEDMYFFTHEMKSAEPVKFERVWDKLADSHKELIHTYSQKLLAAT